MCYLFDTQCHYHSLVGIRITPDVHGIRQGREKAEHMPLIESKNKTTKEQKSLPYCLYSH